ncbi:MAG: tyrosine-type recombinase/integrase [Burkholderiales bacterium]
MARPWFKNALAGVVARRTVRDAAERYVEDRRLRKSDAAAKDAKGRIDRVILPKLGDRPLDRLTTADIDKWLKSMVPTGLDEDATRKAKESANRNLITLKALLNHAWKINLVASNAPWRKAKAFSETSRARDVFLKQAQRASLLEHSPGTFRDLVQAALLTGARYGELCGLLVADFDKAGRILSIRRGKTGGRPVPLSDAAASLIARLARNKLPGAHLFTKDDGRPWQHSDQDELMRDAAKAAKLPKGTVFYTLRHTFIASALTGGMGIHQVAKMCGTSVRMIEKHYDKFLHSDVRERLNRIAFA